MTLSPAAWGRYLGGHGSSPRALMILVVHHVGTIGELKIPPRNVTLQVFFYPYLKSKGNRVGCTLDTEDLLNTKPNVKYRLRSNSTQHSAAPNNMATHGLANAHSPHIARAV